MSGLHEAFEEMAADVPVYGDLDRAIAQAERDRRRRFGLLAGLGAAAAVLAVIVGVLTVTRDGDRAPSPAPSPTPSPTPVVTDGSIYFAAESSAGTALTDFRSYGEVETDAQQMDIYLSRQGQPVRRIIGTKAHERCPAVSPDGARLAYLEGATVVIRPLDADGNPRDRGVRVDLKTEDLYRTDGYRPRNFTGAACPQWSPDGRRLGYRVTLGDPGTPLSDSLTAEVHAVSLDGEDRVLTSFETPVWQAEPAFAWSPDGDEVAYTTVEGVWRVRLDGGTPELVWRAPAADFTTGFRAIDNDRPVSLAWSRHDELAFSVRGFNPTEPDNPLSGGDETWTVHVVNARSGRSFLEADAGSVFEGGAGEGWSPDGSLLVFTGPDGRIRLHDRVAGSTVRVRPQLVGVDGVDFRGATWSPDGHELLARARDDRGFALVSIAVNGFSSEVRTPWTWSLDWASLDDVDWSRR